MKNFYKETEGITLVALIITIIILLILAGVTIAQLTGNGLFEKTKQAKQEYDEASISEQIKLAIMASMMNGNNNFKIDTEVLEIELKKNLGEDIVIEKNGADNGLPWVVSKDGYMFQINENGTVEKVNGITLNKTEIKLIEGGTETITASLTAGINGTITWESSNTSVATVNNGTITAAGTSGTVDIIAKVEGTDYSAKCTVTIVSKVTAIEVKDIEIEVGSSEQLEVTTIPASNIEDLTYSSNDISVATVDETGKVTGVAAGTVTITVTGKTSTTVSDTCTVTVKKPLEAGDIQNAAASFYGAEVTGYTCQSTGVSKWRIYYADNTNIYLIADECIAANNAPVSPGGKSVYQYSTYKLAFHNIIEDSTYSTGSAWILGNTTVDGVERENSKAKKWLSEYLTLYPNASHDGMKAVAYMLDTNIWSQYAGEKAEYAIGGPTVELYCASYKDTHPTKYVEYKVDTDHGYALKWNTEDSYGFYANSGVIGDFNYIYTSKNQSNMWIASPTRKISSSDCHIFYKSYDGHLSYEYCLNDGSGFRPIVCLKSGVQLEKTGEGIYAIKD